MKEPQYKTKLQHILISPGFLFALFVLFFNDFYLKAAFGNFLTGKLSDLAGLFAFPILVAAFAPRRSLAIYAVVASGFIFWKSPFSNFAIDILNSFSPFAFGRVIDYSDWIAITILPISYCYFQFITDRPYGQSAIYRPITVTILLLAMFVFTATQLVRDRTLSINDTYFVEQKHSEMESSLRNSSSILGVKVRRYDELFANMPKGVNLPNSTEDQNTYFFDVTVDRPTCDSHSTLISFLIEEENSGTILRGIDTSFECRAYETAESESELNKKYLEHTKALFNQEILSRLSLVSAK